MGLQVDEDTMQEHAKTFGPEFKDKLEATVKAKDYLVGFTAEAITKLIAVIGLHVASYEAGKSFLKWIPFVGSIAGAAISFKVTRHQLTTALDAHNEIALNAMK